MTSVLVSLLCVALVPVESMTTRNAILRYRLLKL